MPKRIDRAPVLITQHMPATFTAVLAEHLSRASGRGAHEAEHGEPVLPGGSTWRRAPAICAWYATATGSRLGSAMTRRSTSASRRSMPLFSSAADVWGPALLALVLTGMGNDGTRGAADIVAAGGSVIAQDEATSVVWGMPRSVAQAGLCSAVLPLGEIAPKVLGLFSGDRS